MTFNLIGTQAQKDSIKPMVDALTATLGNRIKSDVDVVFKAAADMKKRSDKGPANGYWTSKKRVISLRDEIDDYSVPKTFAHEVMHVIDTDWLTPKQRAEIIELMKPPPDDWRDQFIGLEKMKYVADPSEVYAVYASAAIADLENPAYTSMYERSIHSSLWKDLRAIVMRDQDTGDRGSTEEEEKVVPPDTVDELHEQLDDMRQKLNAARGALAPLQNDLTDTQQKLEAAKADAKAARDELAPIQAQLADAKARAKEARDQLAPTQAQLADATAQLTTAQAQAADANARAKEARDQLAPTQAQLADAKAQLAPLQAQITTAQTELANAKAQLAPLQAQLTTAQTELADAKAQLAPIQAQLTTAQTELADAKAQLAPLQAQLTTAQNEAAAAVAAKDLAEQGRTQASLKLAQAKTNASEIRAALTAGDTITATAKATEISAL